MKLETFCSTLGYMPLQRHLLAVPTHTLEDAVRAGNEFLQIKPGGEKGGNISVRQVEGEREEFLNPTDKAQVTFMQAMQQLVGKVKELQNQPAGTVRKETQNDKKKLC